MWRDLPFSQRNKTTKTAVGVEVEGDRVHGGQTEFEKGRQAMQGGSFWNRAVRNFLPAMMCVYIGNIVYIHTYIYLYI